MAAPLNKGGTRNFFYISICYCINKICAKFGCPRVVVTFKKCNYVYDQLSCGCAQIPLVYKGPPIAFMYIFEILSRELQFILETGTCLCLELLCLFLC